MIKAVFDANLLVSAFISRHNPGGVSNELLRFARQGATQLHLSPDIITETLATLIASERMQARYAYNPAMAIEFCDNLRTAITMIINPPPIPGAVPRDPDDDKIVACAVAAGVEYLVSRDHDLLSLGTYAGITIIAPEEFLHLVRGQSQRP
jgi:putative PIN family toxin of toxin-antitoxin system